MPNQEVRLAVGAPSDLRSTVWKFVVQGNETYILSRMFGEDVKVSLHTSGQCQFSCIGVARRGLDRQICGLIRGGHFGVLPAASCP
jgi:hypothetical protein